VTFSCSGACTGLGSSTTRVFQCNQTLDFQGNCTYILIKVLIVLLCFYFSKNVLQPQSILFFFFFQKTNLSVTLDQGFCNELYPGDMSFTSNQYCVRKVTIRYHDSFFDIFPKDGEVSWRLTLFTVFLLDKPKIRLKSFTWSVSLATFCSVCSLIFLTTGFHPGEWELSTASTNIIKLFWYLLFCFYFAAW